MKFLLSLSLIPLLLLTNVSAAEELQLQNSIVYENPTTPDGYPLLALVEDNSYYDNRSVEETRRIIQDQADALCESLGHKEAEVVLEQDIQFRFEGKAYFNGTIVDTEKENEFDMYDFVKNAFYFYPYKHRTNGIFKTLRCAD